VTKEEKKQGKCPVESPTFLSKNPLKHIESNEVRTAPRWKLKRKNALITGKVFPSVWVDLGLKDTEK